MADFNAFSGTPARVGGTFPMVEPPAPGSLSAFAGSFSTQDPVDEVTGSPSLPRFDPVSLVTQPSVSHTPAPYFVRSSDPLLLDPDPFGTKTVAYGKRTGQNFTDEDVQGLSVFGRPMSREQLLTMESGRRLLELEANKRKGVKRDFWEALTDFSVSDLPFLSLFATVGGSIKDAVDVSDTFKRMQNGEYVSDEDLVKTRLYMAENEYRQNGTWGSTVGDIIRAAPGFMVEFATTGGLLSAARGAATAAAKKGSSVLLPRAAKMVAAELAEDGVKQYAKKEFGAISAKTITSSLENPVFKKGLTDKITKVLLNPKNELLADNPLLRGWSNEALQKAARDRAETEIAKVAARNAGGALHNFFQSAWQWTSSSVSKGLLDFGAFGVETAAKGFTSRTTAGAALRDAVGDLFVKAPITGAAMYSTHFALDPLIGQAAGKDGRVVGGNTLNLQASAYMTGNRYLMENAESMAMGMDLLEYVSESAGAGFGSLLRAGGLALEKAGVKGLVRPAAKTVNAAGDLLNIEDAGVTIGGKMRQFIQRALGTRQDLRANVRKDEAKAVASVLGVTDPSTLGYINRAVATRSTEGLPTSIASRIGPDVGKFVDSAVKQTLANNTDELTYKTFARFALANFMAKHNIGADTVIDMYQRMGYDGVLGEMFEERYSDVAKGLLGLDDEKSHDLQLSDFFDNCKKAVKGLYPGFDQLLAEAVGFSVPLVTQVATRKAIAKVGGTDHFDRLRASVDTLSDALRVPVVETMPLGSLQQSHALTMGHLQEEIDEAHRQEQLELAAGNLESAEQFKHQAESAELEYKRRGERHTRFIQSMPEAIRGNAESIIAVPVLQRSAYRLPESEYRLLTVPTIADAAEASAAQDTLVGIAPELGQKVALMSMEDGLTHKHLRYVARKLLGFAGAVVSGDFSLARLNPEAFIAEESGLSRAFVDNLASVYKDTYRRVKDDLLTHPPTPGMARDQSGAPAFGGPFVDKSAIETEAMKRYAPVARRLMQSGLVAMNLRRFSQEDMREQAIIDVARGQGYEVDAEKQTLSKFDGASGTPEFRDEISFDDFDKNNKEAVDATRDNIALATMDILTNRTTSRTDDYQQVLSVVRLPGKSEILPIALYESALRMAGFSQKDIHTQRLSEDTPINVLLDSSAAGRANMDVAHYVASRRAANLPVDGRAYESLANSLGFRFDGTEKDLARRNRHINLICDLLEFGRDEGAHWFAKEVPVNSADSRFDRDGRILKLVRRTPDGKYRVVVGYDEMGRAVTEEHDTLKEFEHDGWVPTEQKVVITTRNLIETPDLYLMMRNLGLLGEYRQELENYKSEYHPMMRMYSADELEAFRTSRGLPEDMTTEGVAQELADFTLRREIALASRVTMVEGQATVEGEIPAGETFKTMVAAYNKVWGPNGYMTVGENLMSRKGVDTSSTLEALAGYSDAQKVYRYSLLAGNRNLATENIYVPIDVSQSEDFVAGLIDLQLRRAYVTHRGLLSRACSYELLEFVDQTRKLIADRLKDRNLDSTLRAPLAELQRSLMFTSSDRVGLSLNTWTTLASVFGLYQDKRQGLAGLRITPMSRALASIADDVRELPAFPSFLNLVDLSLGGDGFLSEALRDKSKAPEAGSLRGVRKLLSIVSGNTDNFRESVKASLPLGVSYRDFLSHAVDAANALARTGLAGVAGPIRPVSEKGKAKLADIAKQVDSVDKLMDFYSTLASEVGVSVDSFDGFVQEVLKGVSPEAKTAVDDLNKFTATVPEVERRLSDATAALKKAQEQLESLRAKYAEGAKKGPSVTAASDLAKLTDAAQEVENLQGSVDRLAKKVEDSSGLSIQATIEGGDSSPFTEGALKGAIAVEEAEKQADSEVVDDDDSDFSIGFLPESDEDTASKIFNQQAITERSAQGSRLTKAQSELALNVVIRTLHYTGGTTLPTEDDVRRMAGRMFPSISEGDLSSIVLTYQRMDRDRQARGVPDWNGLFTPGSAWSFDDAEVLDSTPTNEESYNQKAIDLYTQQGMADFLSLADISCPETGRNIQAYFSNRREECRQIDSWGLCVTEDQVNAMAFVYELFFPQANRQGTNYNQRRARFDETLARLDDLDFVSKTVSALMANDKDRHPLSRKTAMFLSYLSSLPRNLRLKFCDLAGESVVSTGIHQVRGNDDGHIRFEALAPRSYELKDSIITGSFDILKGKSSFDLELIAKQLDSVCSPEAVAYLAREQGTTLSTNSNSRPQSPETPIIRNSRFIGEALAKIFGHDSPIVVALTSDMMIRRINYEFVAKIESTRHKSLAYALSDQGGVFPIIRDIRSVVTALASSVKRNRLVSEEDIRGVSLAVFKTGSLAYDSLGKGANDPGKLGNLAYLLRTYTDSLPQTIVRGEVDVARDRGARPSVALASPGVVPLVRRFVDLPAGAGGFLDLANKLRRLTYDIEASKNPSNYLDWRPLAKLALSEEELDKELAVRKIRMTAEEKAARIRQDTETWERILAECRQNMTWPDRVRTPIISKNISKSLDPEEIYNGCARSYVEGGRPAYWVPVYAGDHDSSILFQIPEALADAYRPETPVKDLKAAADEKVRGLFSRFAKEMSKALGLNLMADDTKRSSISSLSVPGVSSVGLIKGKNGEPDRYGECRIHIIYNYAMRPKKGTGGASVPGGNPRKDNEAMFGTTVARGYGVEMMRARAKDPLTSTLKYHAINSSGSELFFIKSLGNAFTDARGLPMKGDPKRSIWDYFGDFRKDDPDRDMSLDIGTDADSYKIGIAGSKSIRIKTDTGLVKVMDWVFQQLESEVESGKEVNLDADALDARFGELTVVDRARGGEPAKRKLSDLMPGVMARTVRGFSGPTVALSYREDGTTLYDVANVSHRALPKVTRMPRNNEIDALVMSKALVAGNASKGASRTAETYMDLLSHWGSLVVALNHQPNYVQSVFYKSQSVRENLDGGEAQFGVFNREATFRALASELLKSLPIPAFAVDAPLTSAGATLASPMNTTGTDFTRSVRGHSTSPMLNAMMQGSIVFGEQERKFYREPRRLALCNANFAGTRARYGWFLDDAAFAAAVSEEGSVFHEAYENASDESGDRRVLLTLEGVFTKLQELEAEVVSKPKEEQKGYRKTIRSLREELGKVFLDHHGRSLSEVTVNAKRNGEPVQLKITECQSFADLFIRDPEGGTDRVFDRTAVQIDADRVPLDADGKPHVFLAGSTFGLPRTPSYNGGPWLQVVRLGLPVTETETKDSEGRVSYKVGTDALVEPDPFTNDILGSDHDGDKSKLYMLDASDGRCPLKAPPSAFVKDGDDYRMVNGYLDMCLQQGLLVRKALDPRGNVYELPLNAEKTPGEWFEIPEKVKRQVSNTLVQTLFDMARDLPCEAHGDKRSNFEGNLASRATKPDPLDDDEALSDIIEKHGAEPLVTEAHNLGDPWVAARVSKKAYDANETRGIAVDLAKCLHFGYVAGIHTGHINQAFRSGGPQEIITPRMWFDLANKFDGVSNAAFDDIKSQKCYRLGWTSGLIQVFTTEFLLNRDANGNVGSHACTNDDDAKRIITRFADELFNREKRPISSPLPLIFNLSDPSETAARRFATSIFQGNVDGSYLGRKDLSGFFGLVYKEREGWTIDTKAPRSIGRVIATAALEYASEHSAGHKGQWILSSFARGNFGSGAVQLGFNSWIVRHVLFGDKKVDPVTLSKLKLRQEIKVTPEMARRLKEAVKRYVDFFDMYYQLEDMRTLSDAVNYMGIDPGNESKVSRAGYLAGAAQKFLSEKMCDAGPYEKTLYEMSEVAYRGLTGPGSYFSTLPVKVLKAFEDVRLRQADPGFEWIRAYSDVNGGVNLFDNMQVRRNAAQVPFVFSALNFLKALPGDKDNPFKGGVRNFDVLREMADAVGQIHKRADGTMPPVNRIFDLLRGIEASFRLMARIAGVTREATFGLSDKDSFYNPGFFYFQSLTNNPLYTPETYGVSAYGLKPLTNTFSGGSLQGLRHLQEDLLRIRGGLSFAGSTSETRVPDLDPYGTVRRNKAGEPAYRKMKHPLSCTLTLDGLKNLSALLQDLSGTPRAADRDQRTSMDEDIKVVRALLERKEIWGGKKAEITPAMMFGQLLPIYSVLTEAPRGPSQNTSFLQMTALYPVISAGEASLSRGLSGRILDHLSTLNWNPARLPREGKKEKPDSPGLRKIRNQSARQSVFDLFVSAGEDRFLVREALDRIQDTAPDSKKVYSAGRVDSPNPFSKIYRGRYDRKVGRIAATMKELLGSWANVEYFGGSTFVIHGGLRGDVGSGKYAVITVNFGGKEFRTVNDETTLANLASSRSFANSLCSSVDVGVTPNEFLALPLEVRKSLVRTFGVGGVCSKKITHSVDGEILATTINLNNRASAADSAMYHEYFHAMFGMFKDIGLFSRQDMADLSASFYKPDGSFNEEAAAEGFRKWIVNHENPKATETRNVFQKIYDFIKGILGTLRAWFGDHGYYDEVELDGEKVNPIFATVLSGIAESTPSRREEDPGFAARETEPAVATMRRLQKAAEVSQQSLEEFAAAEAKAFGEHEVEEVSPGADEETNIKEFNNALAEGRWDGIPGILQAMVEDRRAVNPGSRLLKVEQDTGPLAATEDDSDAAFSVGDVPPPGDPAEPAARGRMAVELATVPLASVNPNYMMAEKIVEGIRNDLADHGSWRGDLQSCLKYQADRFRRELNGADAQDRRIVLAALRTAASFVNPSLDLNKANLEKNLVFEAALVAERTMVRHFVDPDQSMQTGRGKTGPVKNVSAYNVAGFLLATRRVAPSEMARVSGDYIRGLLQTKGIGEATKNALGHLAQQMAKLESLIEADGLVNFVRTNGGEKLDDIIKSITAGMRKTEFDENGNLADPELYPQTGHAETEYPGGSANPYSPDNHALYSPVIGEPLFKDAYKTAVRTAFAVVAMNKFYRDLGVIPGTIRDVEAARMLSAGTKAKKPDEFVRQLADLGIGPSTLANEECLVDYYSRSGFIGANTEEWINSHIRENFGKVPLRETLQAEGHHEWAGIVSKIQRLSNMHAFLLGDSEAPGERLHELMWRDAEFSMDFGEVTYKKSGDRFVKFDNYTGLRGRRCDIVVSSDDIGNIDFFKKMLSAYANNQKVIVTGVDNLMFNLNMDTVADAYVWDGPHGLEARWNDGAPEKQLNKLEMALVRIKRQLDIPMLRSTDRGGRDLYTEFWQASTDAIVGAKQAYRALKPEDKPGFDANDFILRELEKKGLVISQKDSTGKRLRGTIVIGTDFVNDAFKKSEIYEKLTSTEGGRTPEMIDRDTLVKETLGVYREMADFVRRHPWLTEGDGKYLNTFRTPLMHFGGSGVFMANAIENIRDKSMARTQALPRYAEAFRKSLNRKDADLPLNEADSALLDMLGDGFRTPERGLGLLEAIRRGRYAKGSVASEKTGLVLSDNPTKTEVSEVIYKRLLDLAWDEQTGEKPRGRIAGVRDLIRIYEDEKGSAGNFATGGLGIDDVSMFERYGILPASMQFDHKVGAAIEQITNAMSLRSTLVNFLMTPASDGSPVFFARPSQIAREEAGKSIPDAVWGEVARWWAEFYNLKYDEAADGITNAEKVYDQIKTVLDMGKGKLQGHRYTPLGDDENDLVSVTGWWAMNDENLGEESSALNSLAGGEAIGYLRQLIQSPRACWGMGGAGFRSRVQRALAWSKSLSVSFSFFFPLATRYESPIGAVGSVATLFGNSKAGSNWLRNHPEYAKTLQMHMPGSGWITKDFLGVSDVLQMMDSHDPFLADLISWASALGITISDRLVNPMEPTKSFVVEDIKRIKAMARKLSPKASAKIGAVLDQMLTRPGEKAFSYVLNATKLAVVAQMAQKLRWEARKRGKAFDPIRDLRKYSGYINAEIGGIDPLRYAWATPRHRSIMNMLLFSWEWTRGAWEAGGGTAIEDFLLGGRSATKEERKYFFGRWVRMFGAVMLGVPALMQIVCKALGIALGRDDDDDKWFTWQNENKSWLSAFDLTPLLKGLETFDNVHFDGAVGRWKKDHPVLGSMLPMYTGSDPANLTTQQRRYYMHFGKQGWEFFRWFNDPDKQFFSKLSMPTQRLMEGILGRNLSFLDKELPFADQGVFERWVNPTMDGATFNFLKAFLPFSVSGLQSFGDAGILPIFGPVSMGASQTAINDRLVAALTKWAYNDKEGYSWGVRRKGKFAKYQTGIVADILEDARRNGVDPKDAYDKALGQVSTKVYGQLFNELPDTPDGDFDVKKITKLARVINRLGLRRSAVIKSIKTKLKKQGRDWSSALTDNQREMYRRITGEAIRNPFDENEERFLPPADEPAKIDY